mgnify:FL=1|tara:strand:+ start:1527 stop:2087 length:561 start_codon:yes stop_codon:yes gene_type:complete
MTIDYIELKNNIALYEIDLNEQSLFDLMKIKTRWPFVYQNTEIKSVEIITETGAQTSNFFDVSRRGIFLNFEKWHEYYDRGFTSILSNVFDLTKDLRFLERELINVTGMECLGNFYVSKPGRKPSFDKHAHDYNVIVKQIYGTAKWILGDEEIILQPQETIHIPKGMPHAVIDSDEKRLSLTINIM